MLRVMIFIPRRTPLQAMTHRHIVSSNRNIPCMSHLQVTVDGGHCSLHIQVTHSGYDENACVSNLPRIDSPIQSSSLFCVVVVSKEKFEAVATCLLAGRALTDRQTNTRDR